jgi:hypothetical protein
MGKRTDNKIISLEDVVEYVQDMDESLKVLKHSAVGQTLLGTPQKPTEFLGLLVQDYLTLHNMTPDDLVERMDSDIEIVEAILDGIMPASFFDPDLIESLALALDYDAAVISLLAGHEISIDAPSTIRSREQEVDEYFNAVSEALFDALDIRYQYTLAQDYDREHQYDLIIRELERIIAQQRRDLKLIKKLKAQLETAGEKLLNKPLTKPEEPTILMTNTLKRIVRQLKDDRQSGVG